MFAGKGMPENASMRLRGQGCTTSSEKHVRGPRPSAVIRCDEIRSSRQASGVGGWPETLARAEVAFLARAEVVFLTRAEVVFLARAGLRSCHEPWCGGTYVLTHSR